ncbi:MAG: four helix bundle protein [Nitrospira sp. CR1.3]|nr:four helix bundle protein [Nitrospira sp. CR1.3]
MPKIERFEEIKAWEMAKELVADVYRLTENGKFSKDFGLRDQIRRASISVMSNIAEGFERGSRKEFSRFLRIAKGSSGEVRSQLYVALELGYLKREEFDVVKVKSENLSRALSGFISYLVRGSEE